MNHRSAIAPTTNRAVMRAVLWIAVAIILPSASRPVFAQGFGYSVLHAFTNSPDGDAPEAAVIQASDGNFYGTTLAGGASGLGSVYRVTPAGVETVLHSFPAAAGDGSQPLGDLIQAADGNLYGTTSAGGANGAGTVFQITLGGTETVIYSFGAAASDGSEPEGGLVQASDTSFYGTCFAGGTAGDGVVFKLTTGGTESVLHTFLGGSTDGSEPAGDLIQAADGNLYGTGLQGGAHSLGVVFKVTLLGQESILHSFAGGAGDGAFPEGVIQAVDGALYGTTFQGGTSDNGAVFKVTLAGTESVIHSFAGGAGDGAAPEPRLLQASNSNLYGATFGGGASGVGAVFQLTLTGSETLIHSFAGGTTDGGAPKSGLIQDTDGDLVGTTASGGSSHNAGIVYVLSPAGATLTSLSPASTPACGPAFTLAVNGSNFVPGAVVDWNGAALTTTFVSGVQLTATVPASAIASPGMANVTVTENGSTSNALTFTITNGVPVLGSISPSSKDAGSPGFTLTARGSCFIAGSTVDWNGSALATTFVSDEELKAAVPASLITTPATAKVTVVTPAPGGGTSSMKTFTILTTTLKLTGASLVKNADGSYTATLSIKNTGFASADNTEIKTSSLGGVATITPLPVSLGAIAAGTTTAANLTYPSTAGAPGAVVYLKVSGTFTGGKFAGSLKVTLP